ncbi:MAG TPA: hypothetical protein VEU09_02575 [Candidatus Binatia bacterium]|nr:hypothetical protein [Candidatus Binatia bacterium]
MILRALDVWFILLVLAVANGTFRTAILIPRVGERAGHIISTILLSLLILATAWLTIGWIHPATFYAAVLIGIVWLGLTVLFEFGAGHFVFHQPWERLIADYDLTKGRIWVLVLIVTVKAPALAAWARGMFKP